MSRITEYDLHPWGWETDPGEERFEINTLDYLTTTTWTPMALFFEVEDSMKNAAVAVLREGVERALSQVRHYAGTVERVEGGGHAIVRKKTSTVRFSVKHLDLPGDDYPSMAKIAKGHFGQEVVGDHGVLLNSPHTFGRRPEAHPDNNPALVSFRVNLVRGGLIFLIQTHHYGNGIAGWAAWAQQIADNCFAIANRTSFPSFDPKYLDRHLFTELGFERPSSSKPGSESLKSQDRGKSDTSSQAGIQSKRRPMQSLLFHLPKSKASTLKQAASPTDDTWISTYDAVCALMWRVFSRIREPLYKPDSAYKPLFGTGVTIKKGRDNCALPEKLQGNIQFDISSTESSLPQLSVAEVISEAPLSRLASYMRQFTRSVTTEMLSETLQGLADVRNKVELSISVDAMPPMALYVTDWRVCNISAMDFGFAKPLAYRHLFGTVVGGQCLVYPPRKGPAGEDEGIELQVTFEEELVPQLVNDPEWSKYFEFRGVDLWEEGRGNHQAKL